MCRTLGTLLTAGTPNKTCASGDLPVCNTFLKKIGAVLTSPEEVGDLNDGSPVDTTVIV